MTKAFENKNIPLQSPIVYIKITGPRFANSVRGTVDKCETVDRTGIANKCECETVVTQQNKLNADRNSRNVNGNKRKTAEYSKFEFLTLLKWGNIF